MYICIHIYMCVERERRICPVFSYALFLWVCMSLYMAMVMVMMMMMCEKEKVKEKKQEWDNSLASLQQLQAKDRCRHMAAMRRERALAYAFSEQVHILFPHFHFPSNPLHSYLPSSFPLLFLHHSHFMFCHPGACNVGVVRLGLGIS